MVVLEAMKMENSLPAPVSGTIQSINFNSGDSVSKNNVLYIDRIKRLGKFVENYDFKAKTGFSKISGACPPGRRGRRSGQSTGNCRWDGRLSGRGEGPDPCRAGTKGAG
ncbi:MAG: acetyl-CoA carboxylase biotin carboxyl carrier protein subunit [Desulfobacterales bacterium]